MMLTKSGGLYLGASIAVVAAAILTLMIIAPSNLDAVQPTQETTSVDSSTMSSTFTITLSSITLTTTTSTTPGATSTTTTSTSTTTTRSRTTSTTVSTTSSTSSGPFVAVVIPYGAGDNESVNFQPSSITVVIGINNTIVFSDMDAVQHTVTSMSLPQGAVKFDSGVMNQGQMFTLTLSVPGTYRFYCTIHPTWMRGTIVVRP